MFTRCLGKLRYYLEAFVEPLVLLGIRVYMWNIFYTSGRQKFEYFLNDDWGSTIFLFQEVHPVPFIPAEIAAVMGTTGELVLSSLLIAGLFSRFSAIGLLFMVGVIEFSFQYNDPEYTTLTDHITWALLLSVILVRGAGALSLDRLFFKKAIM